ncbi:hypothetical protein GQ457_12G020310 [Hibiscus cannabinus]
MVLSIFKPLWDWLVVLLVTMQVIGSLGLINMLVCVIASLVDRPWIVDFMLVRREANLATDFLVELPTQNDSCTRVFHDPPPSLLSVLNQDLHGPVHHRS